MKDVNEYRDGMLWFMDEGEGTLLVGVTQQAIDACGTVSEVETSDADDEHEANDWIGEIRGKNSVLDIVAPFDLKVLEVNEEVIGQPALLEDDPTGDAWILRVAKNES